MNTTPVQGGVGGMPAHLPTQPHASPQVQHLILDTLKRSQRSDGWQSTFGLRERVGKVMELYVE